MELHDLRLEMEKRFDRLEQKLDRYSADSSQNKADLVWVKGYIRTSFGILAGILTTIVGFILHGGNIQ